MTATVTTAAALAQNVDPATLDGHERAAARKLRAARAHLDAARGALWREDVA